MASSQQNPGVHELEYIANGMYLCKRCGYGLSANDTMPCEVEKDTPKNRRFLALGLMFNRYAPLDDAELFAKRFMIADEIRKLAPLGRADRWKVVIEAWASTTAMAEDASECRWAFCQFCIRCNWANDR